MATETERKFLVMGSFKQFAVNKEVIIQAYISVTPEATVRIRLKGDKAFLTVKGRSRKGTISRKEWEFEIDYNDASEMLELCQPGRIDKTRYYIPAGKHIFEVDEFHGKNEGLVIAEIEMDDENEYFERPNWLGEEVTGNPAYYNSNLI